MLFDIDFGEFLDLVVDSHVKFKHVVLFDLIMFFNNNTGVIFFCVRKSIKCINTVNALRFDMVKGILNTNFIDNIRIIKSL